LGDVDGDGDLDIVTANFQGQNIVYKNNGTGSTWTGINFGTGSDWTESVALGDVDNDGDLDIVTGNRYQQDIVYLNSGTGDAWTTGVNFGTGTDDTWSVALGDVDGDSALDIVTGNNDTQNIIYKNEVSNPEINIEGNSIKINNSDITPDVSDHTDFGSAIVSSSFVERTFTVKNIGDAVLNLLGTPKVKLSGAHAGDFSVITQPNSPITTINGSTSFTVRFGANLR
jgi:hypothetical protein